MQSGRYRLNPAAGTPTEEIAAEVCRRLRVEQGAGREIAREAVEDALEGRRPRW